ncbi:MAG: 6-phosphogluconolactonase [Candidatus Saccharimonadales bacterium]
MHYFHSNKPIFDSAEYAARLIRQQLYAGKRVLWLLSGGSGIKVDVAAAKLLAGTDNLSNLIVSLTDERYGKQGHADENWRELLEAGFVLTGAKLYRPLRATDKLSTLDAYDAWMKKQFAAADYVIGIFGIGSDGHTAGIKPNSDATSAAGYTTHFEGDDYERMTITYQAINKMDAAIIQASGVDKRATLQQLLDKSLPLADMPAQILHKVPDVSLYTDCELTQN